MLEAMFGAVWFRSPQFIKALLSKGAHYVCHELDGFTAPTTHTRLAAGNAIAAFQILNIKKALDEPSPPSSIYSTLASFTKEEWKEVLAIAESTKDFLDTDLEESRWSHLRRIPD